MAGYWAGKVFFNMKDADRISATETKDIDEWHMDICTYIHHSVPYALILLLQFELSTNTKGIVLKECYGACTLFWTYMWMYAWFCFVYMPWRVLTGDIVYSVLGSKTDLVGVCFVVIPIAGVISNLVGWLLC